MPKLIEYKDMQPRAKAVVEKIAAGRASDPADINNVWKALARHPDLMEQFAEEMFGEFVSIVTLAQKGNKIAAAYRVPVDAAFEEN